MTSVPLEDLQPIPNRPGMRGRDLIGSQHGVTSFFVSEMEMDQGSRIPLHTHPVEEAFVVLEGALEVRIGDQTVVAEASSTIRIPGGVPHAVLNAEPGTARALAGAAWSRDTWFQEATSFLEGLPRT